MTEVTDKRLLSFVERLERLQAEKDAISADMKEVRKECKSAGYDLPALARLLKRRKLDREERQEQDALDETYQKALGMLAGTPLGEASAPKKVDGDGRVTDDEPGDRDDLKEEIIAEFQKAGLMAKSPEPPSSPPDRIAASVDAVKRQMQAAG